MARPPKEGMDYFPHDCNASNEKKIEALRTLYGNDGYAFYFILLEQIYQEPNFELDVSDAETREEMWQILARKVSVTPEKFDQMLNTAINWGCFDKELFNENGILTSHGIKKRAGVVTEKREKMREKYQQKKEAVSDAETKEETPQSKEKERKDKEKERNIYHIPVPVGKGNDYSPEFEEFWKYYPRNREKKAAYKAWNTQLKNKASPADMILAARNYADECRRKRTEESYIKHGATFLGPNSPWSDYLKEVGTDESDKYKRDDYNG